MAATGIVMRVHRVRAEIVVAACDEELLNRELRVGRSGRIVRVSAQFYGDRRVPEEEFLWQIRRATVANLLGPRVCALAEREGLLAPQGTGELGGVPHAEIFAMLG